MRKHFYLLTTLMAAVLLALPAVNTQAVRMLRQSAPTLKAAAEDNAVYIRVSQNPDTIGFFSNKEVNFYSLVSYLNASAEELAEIIGYNTGVNNIYHWAKGKDRIVFYLVSDITFNPYSHHIKSIPANVTIDGRYHTIHIPEELIDIPAMQLICVKENNSTIGYAGGLLVDENRGAITRLQFVGLNDSPSISFNPLVELTEEDSDTAFLGSFCGANFGEISECSVNADFVPTGFSGATTVYMGGIAGYNAGTIRNTQSNSAFTGYIIAFGLPESSYYQGTAVGYATDSSVCENVVATLNKDRLQNAAPAEGQPTKYNSITEENTFFAGNKKGNNQKFIASNYYSDDETQDPHIQRKFGEGCESQDAGEVFGNYVSFTAGINEDGEYNRTPDVSPLGYFYYTLTEDYTFVVNLLGFATDNYGRPLVHGEYNSIISNILHQAKPDELYLHDTGITANYSELAFISYALGAAGTSPEDNILTNLGITSKELLLYKKGTPLRANAAPLVSFEYNPDLPLTAIIKELPPDWTFNGKLTTSEADYPGNVRTSYPLVGSIAKGATVKNFEVSFTSPEKSESFPEFDSCSELEKPTDIYGTVASINFGRIENVVAKGNITARACSDRSFYYDKEGNETVCFKDLYAGGIVGYNLGEIRSAWSNVHISITPLEPIEGVAGKVYVGGIAGGNVQGATNGTIEDAFLFTGIGENEEPIININDSRTEKAAAENNVQGSVGYIVGIGSNGITNTYRSDLGADPLSNVYALSAKLSEMTLNNQTNLRPEDGDYSDGEKLFFVGNVSVINTDVKRKNLYTSQQSLFNFRNIGRWKMESGELGEMMSAMADFYQYPTLNFSECETSLAEVKEDKDGNNYVDMSIENEHEYDAVASLIMQSNHVFGNANIAICNDLDLSAGMPAEYLSQQWNASTKIEDVVELPSLGTAQAPFTGTIDGLGHSISNMVGAFADGSLFGNLGKAATDTTTAVAATVQNLSFEGRIFVDINMYKQNAAADADGNVQVFVPAFAQNLTGQTSGLNFSGSIYFDDSHLGADTTAVICLVDQTNAADGSAVNNSFLYLFTDDDKAAEADDNKACIVIKQNVGVGRGKANKTATSKLAAVNKSGVATYDLSQYRMKATEEFTAKEFASGEVAAWLNFRESGFNGEFTGMYAQGEGKPKFASNKSAAVQVLQYSVVGIEETVPTYDASQIGNYISGPMFAASGELIDVEFTGDMLPNQIYLSTRAKARGEQQTLAANAVQFTMPESQSGIAYLKTAYNNASIEGEGEAIGYMPQSQIKVISVRGGIRITGAEGLLAKVTNLGGQMIARKFVASDELISLPRGIFIVNIGNENAKVIVE